MQNAPFNSPEVLVDLIVSESIDFKINRDQFTKKTNILLGIVT